MQAIQVKTIIAALDGSDHANKALNIAADLAEKYDARLIALHVTTDKPLSDGERDLATSEYHADNFDKINTDGLIDVRGDPRAVAVMLAQQYSDMARQIRQVVGKQLMAEARACARAKGIDSIETMIEEGDPTTLILTTAKDKNADMIVLGSRGLGDLKGLMMGSVSHKVSQMAECTCITVK